MARKNKPGAGRPRSVGGRASVEVGLVISDRLNDGLVAAADGLGVTKSELMRRLLERGLTEKQQGVIIRHQGGRHA
jgi:hypothetical protein